MSVLPGSQPLRHNRDFLLLWSGQTVSQLGSGVSTIAFPLLVLALTHSPAQAGFVGTLGAIPYLIFGLPGGALADRWNRKQVMIVCDIGRALALGSIPLAAAVGHLGVIQIYAAVALSSSLYVFFNVAQGAALPHVVSENQLADAISWNAATGESTGVLAASAGGVLFQLARAVPFLVDGVSYAVSALSLLLIRTEFQGERKKEPRSLLADIREGMAFVWGEPVVRFIVLTYGVGALVDAGIPLVLIVLAKHQHASPSLIGIMFALGSIGGVLGSLLAPRLLRRLSFQRATTIVMWVLAVLYPLYAVAPHPLLIGLVLLVESAVVPLFMTATETYQLARTPDALRSRAASVVRLLSSVGWPLGLALSGILIQSIGAVTTMLLIAAVNVGLAIATSISPAIRSAPPVSVGDVSE